MPLSLTLKQRKFVKEIAAGKNGKEAAIAAGYSPKQAKNIASETLRKATIQPALRRAYRRLHLTELDMLRPIQAAYQATKLVTSPTEPDREMPDHVVRLKASELDGRFRKLLGASEAADGASGPVPLTIQIVNYVQTHTS